MTLPFNNYKSLRYYGNEYVTDQMLNRVTFRFFKNDEYLDKTIDAHMNNDLIHNAGAGESLQNSYLTGDRLIILDGEHQEDEILSVELGTYRHKGWQRLIDEQPRDLGGKTLVFRFQINATAHSNDSNGTLEGGVLKPSALIFIDRLNFAGFYGGNLIIESPAAYYKVGGVDLVGVQTADSAVNQLLQLTGNGKTDRLFKIINAHCHVTIQNCRFRMPGNGGATTVGSWNNKETAYANGNLYYNSTDGTYKRYSPILNEWMELNMLSLFEVVDSPDVLVRHCYLDY